MAIQVLAVDDDALINELLTITLRGAGYRTEAVSSMDEALAMLESVTPDILLLDLNMPGGGGLDILRAIALSERLARTRAIMLTAEGDLHFIEQARRLGAIGYLMKPVDPAQLTEKVGRVLEDRGVRWIDDYSLLRAPAA